MNKYKVNPSTELKYLSVRFNSVKHLDLIKPVLDAGGENDFAKELGINNFISGDLNYAKFFQDEYKTITSFEVIEHLQNPLIYLRSICDNLTYDGTLYLTTPVRWIFKGKFHFHEFSKEELIFCLKEAGFNTIEVSRIQAYNLAHFGIRPLIRKLRDMILGQCFLIKATK